MNTTYQKINKIRFMVETMTEEDFVDCLFDKGKTIVFLYRIIDEVFPAGDRAGIFTFLGFNEILVPAYPLDCLTYLVYDYNKDLYDKYRLLLEEYDFFLKERVQINGRNMYDDIQSSKTHNTGY